MKDDQIIIERLVLGQISTNCYLIIHPQTESAVVIDPADHSRRIIQACRDRNVQLTDILLTHGHYDHIGAVEELRQAFGIPVRAALAERHLLKDPRENLSVMFAGGPGISLEADEWFEDGQMLSCAGISWQVLLTPGHTPGSCCFYAKEQAVLFSGDTLFQGSAGRTDFPGGSWESLISSVHTKLLVLPDETKVFPGHGPASTIGQERRNNPFFRN